MEGSNDEIHTSCSIIGKFILALGKKEHLKDRESFHAHMLFTQTKALFISMVTKSYRLFYSSL